MKAVFLFPGQGSQFVGMGRDLAEASPRAAAVFAEANDALGTDLRAICFDAPRRSSPAPTTPSRPSSPTAWPRSANWHTGVMVYSSMQMV